MRALEGDKREGKERDVTVELQSHEKSRGGAPIPCYSLQAPLPTLPLSSSYFLLAQHVQKRHTKVEGREGGRVN